MSDKAQLAGQIRFALEQLSERNAHHEWEHLCRHLARQRICANILPATGPVQAGGDQGRDFETFRTYLARSPLGGHSFVGLISEKPLAFACTLEKTVASKVRRDVTTIMSSGTPVEGVYVFCTSDLPVAKRHELQKWACKEYDVSLEIIDGAAVAEWLSDRDLIWLAQRYLQLPTELAPVLPAGEKEKDWYARMLDKWQLAARPARTFADFSEIRAAARIALGPFSYETDGRPVPHYERPELPFWIELLDQMADQATFDLLQRRAFYEATVLRLRGLGTLIGQEQRIRAYFAVIPKLHDSADLEDASVLLTYMLPASGLGQVGLDHSEVTKWMDALRSCLDEHLLEADKQDRVNESCALLLVRGHMGLFTRFDEGVIDATEALTDWSRLAELIPDAPLFPLERFADQLAEYARYIGSHPDYGPLTQAMDALLAKRFGHFKAAEKCLERAKAFAEIGDLPRAMLQVHRAKINWFTRETLGKALMALNWLSNAYTEQGLLFAAKYYALSAAYLALHSQDLHPKRYIARSLACAASCDYALGAWHGFLELAETTATIYPHFTHDRDADFNDPDGVLHHLFFYLGPLPVVTKLLYPDLARYSQERCTSVADLLNLVDLREEVQTVAEEAWVSKGPLEFWEAIEGQLAGPPWSDTGPMRRAQWKAHGIDWRVEWPNDYETTLVAEGFLAALQIFLSDLAGHDLCLMRSDLNVSLHVVPPDSTDVASSATAYKGFDTHFRPSHSERLATVMLPPCHHLRDGVLTHQDIEVGVLSVVSSLLTEVSLLPTDSFHKLLHERFEQGLQNKLHVGAPYEQCLREFVTKETFIASERVAHVTPQRQFVSRLSDKLPWFDGPGPGYNPEEALDMIQNRYKRFSLPIARTLRHLVQEPEFQTTVARLRADEWKDWHILSAIFHVTINYRIDHRRILLPSLQAEIEVSERMSNQPEPQDVPLLPLEEYTEERLRQQLPVYLMPFIKTYGLENHQITPDFPAIEDFLAHRYNFWTDDLDHDDPFKPEQQANKD